MEATPVLHATRFVELAIVNREPGLWRYHVDGRDVGPQFKTKGEILAFAEQYAKDYGLIDYANDTQGKAIVRAIETLEHCHLDAYVIAGVCKELRAALPA